MVMLARSGQAPATTAEAVAMNDTETRLARAQYQPLTFADQIPGTTSLLFLMRRRGSSGDAGHDATL